MSETEEDRSSYAAAEAAFIRRRGTPFLLSPTDFALLKQWRALGVPLEAVESGIDEAFTRREERSAIGRVNSLSYCRDAVLEAWERRAQTARGKGSSLAAPEPDAHAALSGLAPRVRAPFPGAPGEVGEAARGDRDLPGAARSPVGGRALRGAGGDRTRRARPPGHCAPLRSRRPDGLDDGREDAPRAVAPGGPREARASEALAVV